MYLRKYIIYIRYCEKFYLSVNFIKKEINSSQAEPIWIVGLRLKYSLSDMQERGTFDVPGAKIFQIAPQI